MRGRSAAASLPEDSTGFVGRRAEQKQARALLGESRLLTITGSGGVGKTRLAIEVAKEVSRSFDDVWFLDLGILAPTGSVPDAIASGVGLQSPEGDVTSGVAEFIDDRKVLLILDSCEHVLDQCVDAALILLSLCPFLQIMATSRAPLRLRQEVVLALGTLPTPADFGSRIPPISSPAVRLFLDRAARWNHDVDAEADLDVIADICRQLDGLPLAIELAAARMKALSPTELRDRMRDSFTVLSGGYRDMPRRQQSMHLAIDWSYRLCSPDEQRLWRGMSVFVGGWDLSAAEWVDSDRPDHPSTLDIVQSLLEKSIIVRRRVNGSTWYAMLSTVREFGVQLLTATDALTTALERHRDWYLRRAHQAESEWIGPQQGFWLALFRRELPNIRAALIFCITSRDGDSALELIVTAWRICWQADARLAEFRRWLSRALSTPGKEYNSYRAQASALLARLEDIHGDHAGARRHLAHARSIALGVGDPFTTAYVDTAEAEMTTDPNEAIKLFRAAIDAHEKSLVNGRQGDPSVRLSMFYDRIGRASDARSIRNRLLEDYAKRGEHYETSYLLMHAGEMAAQRGETEDALAMTTASLKLKRTLDNPVGVAHTQETLASVAFQQKRYERAVTLLGVARAERARSGARPQDGPAFVADIDRISETARHVLGVAGFDRAFTRGADMSSDEGIAFALEESWSRPSDKPVRERRDEAVQLTRREIEVAALVARGLSDREISTSLVIAQRTAEGHVQRALVKLGLTSRTQLSAWWWSTQGPAPDSSGG